MLLTQGLILLACVCAVSLAKPQMPFPFSMLSDHFSGSKVKETYTFTYEGVTPQSVITGCQGTKYSNGDTHTEFYVIDATRRKKFVYPGGSIEISFPATSPEFVIKSNPVKYNEMCFPKQCGVNTCGYVVGPVTVPGLPEYTAKNDEKSNADKTNSKPANLLAPLPVTSTMTVGNLDDKPSKNEARQATTTAAPTTTTPQPCPATTPTPAPCPPPTVPPCPVTIPPPTVPPCPNVTTTTTTPAPTTQPPCPVTTPTPSPCPPPTVPPCPVTIPPPTVPPCPNVTTTTTTPAPTTQPPCPVTTPTPAPCPTTPRPPCPNTVHKESGGGSGGPITDASYYAKLPGAIRGSAGVIYYPSCEKNAFHQVAIIPYCGNSNSKRSRDLKDLKGPNELESNKKILKDHSNEVKEENDTQSK